MWYVHWVGVIKVPFDNLKVNVVEQLQNCKAITYVSTISKYFNRTVTEWVKCLKNKKSHKSLISINN